MRKLRKPESIGFLDGDYDEFLYDPTLYWIKVHLQNNIKISWKLEEKKGEFNLARLYIDPKYCSIVTKTEPIITCSLENCSAKIGEFIHVQFNCKLDEAKLRLVPLVDLGNGKLAVNYENSLLISGPLESIIRRQESRIIAFIPITHANFVIKYSVVDMKTNQQASGKIRITVTE